MIWTVKNKNGECNRILMETIYGFVLYDIHEKKLLVQVSFNNYEEATKYLDNENAVIWNKIF